jgi:hypothetical protein
MAKIGSEIKAEDEKDGPAEMLVNYIYFIR